MDVVIPYVNGMDAEWRMSYALNAGGHVDEKRYYDWGTLKYVLRGFLVGFAVAKVIVSESN